MAILQSGDQSKSEKVSMEIKTLIMTHKIK